MYTNEWEGKRMKQALVIILMIMGMIFTSAHAKETASPLVRQEFV
jgi:hypothetical protein